ncbi:MAG TPA: hypothetical protein VK579_01565 [Terriglobales bacterium]|nr:hypothetical protein [Terriglobales bacterium]
MSSDSEKRCLHISVPPDVCMLWFSDDHIVHSGRLGTSARGEEMGGHCDAAGRILEIERTK